MADIKWNLRNNPKEDRRKGKKEQRTEGKNRKTYKDTAGLHLTVSVITLNVGGIYSN